MTVRVSSGNDLLNIPTQLTVTNAEAALGTLRGEKTNLLLLVAGRLGPY